MGTKGYHSYRGRRGARRVLGVALLALILLAACVYLFLQRYVTFTDSGEVRLDLPFFQQQEDTAGEAPPADGGSEDVNLVIDAPEEQTPEAEETAVPYGEHRLVGLSALPADGAALAETLAAQGANGFVYGVKDNTGKVSYDSAVALRDAVASDGPDSQLLSALCQQEGVLSVARLNCFHDSYYAFAHMESAGICQSSGYIWYDNLSYHWLDPAKEQARSYVIDLALECARLGFDELLLEDVHYPSAGKLEKIDYSGNALGKTQALVQFLTELKEALAPYDVRVALLLDEETLLAQDGGALAETTGQDLGQLLPLVDAVYARTSDPAAVEAAVAAAAGENPPAFVPIADQAPSVGDWYLP